MKNQNLIFDNLKWKKGNWSKIEIIYRFWFKPLNRRKIRFVCDLRNDYLLSWDKTEVTSLYSQSDATPILNMGNSRLHHTGKLVRKSNQDGSYTVSKGYQLLLHYSFSLERLLEIKCAGRKLTMGILLDYKSVISLLVPAKYVSSTQKACILIKRAFLVKFYA